MTVDHIDMTRTGELKLLSTSVLGPLASREYEHARGAASAERWRQSRAPGELAEPFVDHPHAHAGGSPHSPLHSPHSPSHASPTLSASLEELVRRSPYDISPAHSPAP